MKDFIKYNKLFACYSKLLTENEQTTFSDYYEEDLSLQEIAENKNVSRSAVHKAIKNVEEKLDFYEKNLKLCSILDSLELLSNEQEITKIKEKIKEILEEF